MKIAVCYDLPKGKGQGNNLNDRQLAFLMNTLTRLGHSPVAAGFTGSPDKYTQTVRKIKPDLMWNLFESFNGSQSLAYMGVLLLDDIGIPYTGNSPQAMLFTTDSSVMKTILRDAQIPVLPHYRLGDDVPDFVRGTWHLRPLHGGKEDHAVTVANLEDLQKAIVLKSLMGEYYAERQISGRVFHAAVLSTVKGMTVAGFAEERSDGSFTVGNLSVDISSAGNMKNSAVKCARVLGLNGFAMISFSVGEAGRAYLTNVDTKPELAEESLFCKICAKAGVANADVLQVLIATAQKK